MNFKSLAALLTAAAVPQVVVAGPLSYAICQTGCNGVAVACYAGAGFVFGVALPLAPPAVLACNTALGGCMAACAVVAFMPIP
ncbi:cysteine-rich protein [Suillus bovinus]|uniref:cysteine-rich protein n=1 Tax=Suillus bovinus TaxID=48563 RepID=UPI001B873965|nr:cysteine-rich protein [Suillus bovinus]KAG2158745.1 cysteine-rich protein [Suillus bovinus]